MADWIFKSNPDLFKLDERLQDPEILTTWKVSKYGDKIQVGDIAFIWRTGPSRGIVAVMEIICKPREMFELEHEQKYWEVCDTKSIIRVLGTFNHRFPCISYKKLKQIPNLKTYLYFMVFRN